MTKQDFRKLAIILGNARGREKKKSKSYERLERLTAEIISFCYSQNSNFSKSKFENWVEETERVERTYIG